MRVAVTQTGSHPSGWRSPATASGLIAGKPWPQIRVPKYAKLTSNARSPAGLVPGARYRPTSAEGRQGLVGYA